MSEYPGQNVRVDDMFAASARDYERIVDFGTFGADRIWKRNTIAFTKDLATRAGIKNPRILDVASGTGRYTEMLDGALHPAAIVGVDVTPDMVQVAKAIRPGYEFQVQSAEELDFPRDSFDVVTSWYVPKYVDDKLFLDGVDRVLRPGGILVLADFARPRNLFSRMGYFATLKTLSLGAPLFPKAGSMFVQLNDLLAVDDWMDRYRPQLQSRYSTAGEYYLFPDAASVMWGVK